VEPVNYKEWRGHGFLFDTFWQVWGMFLLHYSGRSFVRAAIALAVQSYWNTGREMIYYHLAPEQKCLA
jgi:hypothetical protein